MSDKMEDVAPNQKTMPSGSTRAGDDDLRPTPPDAIEVSRRLKEQKAHKYEPKIVVKTQIDEQAYTEVPSIMCKYCARIAIAIVVLWILYISGSSLYHIAVVSSCTMKIAIALIGLAEIAIVTYLLWKVCRVFSPLHSIEQLKKLQCEEDAESSEAKLRPYALKFGEPEEYARRTFDEKESKEIEELLNRVQRHDYADSTGFIQEYKEFQQKLDKRADAIIEKYALIVAVKTAASPWKILDMLAVFMNSTLMVCEISAIYNRRVPSQEAFKLVIRWMMNIYVAGEAGNLVENAIQSATEAIGNTCLKAAAPILGKVAEGGVNAALLYRLGYSAKNKFAALVD